MKNWILGLGFLFCWLSVNAEEQILRHRAYLGMGYGAVTPEEATANKLPDANGLLIKRILTNGPAAQAGIRIGDVLRSLDSNSVTGESEFRDMLRKYYSGDTIAAGLFREGRSVSVRLTAGSFPEEQAEGLDIEYCAFSSAGTLLRAVLAAPAGTQGKPLPAALMVTALGSPQLIGVPFYSSSRDFAYHLARSGYRVLRFELRGVGDSEGQDYHATDFHSEVEDNSAALAYLLARKDVDTQRVFVYGHSTGGMEAAVLAGKHPIAGLIVSCTIGRTFYERMTDTLRLQMELAGDSGAEIDRKIKRYIEFAALIARGQTSADALRQMPEFASYFNSAGRIMDDRTVDFWRQQLNLNLAETYARVKAPVLILYAASDFITSQTCHEKIRDFLTAAGNKDVTLAVLQGLDHAYAQAADRKASYENYKSGRFIEHPAAKDHVIAWLKSH